MKNRIQIEIKQFFALLSRKQIEVYNEFSLQHELGIYLRKVFPQYKIQFERNTKFFGISDCIKHEIDIVIYNETEKYAIELKYPLNGQYPEQMYSFIKDIKFCEELKENGFNSTFCVTLVQDKNFYEGKRIDGIYSYFRSNNAISGIITKPTGAKKEDVKVHGLYHINWENCNDERFYIVECI